MDDLLATGGTIKCVVNMLEKRKKEILAISVIIELTSLKGSYLFDTPVYSEVKY